MAGLHSVPQWPFIGLVLFSTFIYKLGVRKKSLLMHRLCLLEWGMLESVTIQGDVHNLKKCPKNMVNSIKVSTKIPAKAGLISCVNAR